MSPTRRLAAILAADVVGYSRLIERDEAGTLAALRERRKKVVDPAVTRHHGRIVKVMGDGVLVEFGSAVNAVACAVELQKQFAAANEGVAEDRHIVLRIGVNLGDVVVEAGDLYGDGVIIAVRLQTMAEPDGINISGSVHEQVAGKLEATFDDLGLCEVKNSSKPVRVFRLRTDGRQQMPAPPIAALSIAVLPLDNLSGDPGQQYLSDGIAEDIITELSRFRNLAVAARHASFHFRGKGVSLSQVARELGVAYFLEGSLRKTGDRIRVTVQLIDARTGSHIWAERYDREARDIFTVQDEIVSAIVNMLEGRMVATEAAIARGKPTASWSAYDCLLQGRELCNRYREPEAVPLFAQAIAIDPRFALAHAWLAIALILANVFALDPHKMAEAERASNRALELDAHDATSQWARAMVLLWSGEYERARPYFDRAIALNPADIQIKGDYANWQRLSGNPTQALATIDNALALGAFVPDWFSAVRGQVLFDLERYVEAVEALDALPMHYQSGTLYIAAARAFLGDGPGAVREVAKAREARPGLSLRDVARVIRYANDGAQRHFMDGLRKAGLPE